MVTLVTSELLLAEGMPGERSEEEGRSGEDARRVPNSGADCVGAHRGDTCNVDRVYVNMDLIQTII